MPNQKFVEIASSIAGPVYPICPAFTENGELDLEGTSAYVRYLVENGARHVMTTAGTSRFNLLSDIEVKALNACVVESSGSALTIIGNPMNGGTASAIAFAKHSQEIGADAYLVYYPERFYSNEDVFEYFYSVSRAVPDIGIMIHATPMRAAAPTSGPTEPFSVKLVEMMCDLPNFIGMKEEHGSENLRYNLVTKFGNDLAFVVAGSAMAMYVACAPYGVKTYLTSVGSYRPEIEERFYTLHTKGEVEKALRIVREYEDPFFVVGKPVGWHLAMKATLDLMGLMPKYEREPLKPLSDVARKPIVDVLKSFGWI
ncbi:MAG: dihydrodipicolinate synthase family protein [Rhodospirillaceae bacterium]